MENNFSRLNQKSHPAILVFRFSINIRVIAGAGFGLAHTSDSYHASSTNQIAKQETTLLHPFMSMWTDSRGNVFAHVFVIACIPRVHYIFIERMAYKGVVQFVPSSHLKPKKNIWVFSATLHYWDCKISLLNDKNQGVYRRVYEFWCAFVLVVNMTTQHTTQHNTT